MQVTDPTHAHHHNITPGPYITHAHAPGESNHHFTPENLPSPRLIVSLPSLRSPPPDPAPPAPRSPHPTPAGERHRSARARRPARRPVAVIPSFRLLTTRACVLSAGRDRWGRAPGSRRRRGRAAWRRRRRGPGPTTTTLSSCSSLGIAVGAARSLCLSKRVCKGVLRRTRARVRGIGVGFGHMRSVDLAPVACGRVRFARLIRLPSGLGSG